MIILPFQSAGGLTNFLRAGLTLGRPSGSEYSSSGDSQPDQQLDMKVPPITLPSGMDRLPLPLPFSPDLLWRYPNPFLAQPPPSPLETQVKSGLPGNIHIRHIQGVPIFFLELNTLGKPSKKIISVEKDIVSFSKIWLTPPPP